MSDLRQLAEAATPGPWRAVARSKTREFDQIAIRAKNAHEWATAQTTIIRVPLLGDLGAKNAAYIGACSPERILALLDVVDRSRELNDARLNVSAALTGNIGDVLGLCAAEALHWDALRKALERLAASSRTGEAG